VGWLSSSAVSARCGFIKHHFPNIFTRLKLLHLAAVEVQPQRVALIERCERQVLRLRGAVAGPPGGRLLQRGDRAILLQLRLRLRLLWPLRLLLLWLRLRLCRRWSWR